jgi:hypothetical protein
VTVRAEAPVQQMPFDQPSQVSSECGEVLVDCPEGRSYSMTPDAAWETGSRLIHHATRAREKDGSGSQSELE